MGAIMQPLGRRFRHGPGCNNACMVRDVWPRNVNVMFVNGSDYMWDRSMCSQSIVDSAAGSIHNRFWFDYISIWRSRSRSGIAIRVRPIIDMDLSHQTYELYRRSIWVQHVARARSIIELRPSIHAWYELDITSIHQVCWVEPYSNSVQCMPDLTMIDTISIWCWYNIDDRNGHTRPRNTIESIVTMHEMQYNPSVIATTVDVPVRDML